MNPYPGVDIKIEVALLQQKSSYIQEHRKSKHVVTKMISVCVRERERERERESFTIFLSTKLRGRYLFSKCERKKINFY